MRGQEREVQAVLVKEKAVDWVRQQEKGNHGK